MAKNENLHKAKDAKNDEFYTLLSSVSEELRHYKQHSTLSRITRTTVMAVSLATMTVLRFARPSSVNLYMGRSSVPLLLIP